MMFFLLTAVKRANELMLSPFLLFADYSDGTVMISFTVITVTAG